MSSPTRQTTCNTERDGGLHKFRYDSESDSYILTGNASEDELYGSLRRKLHPVASSVYFWEQDGPARNPIIPTASVTNERALDEDGQIIYGRRCVCARTDDVYCPVGAYLCRIVEPNSRIYRVQCEEDTQGLGVRFVLPLVIFMFVFFACLLVSSPKGKYAQGYLRKVLCCWTSDRYEQELRREIDHRARRDNRRRMRAQRRNPNRVYYTEDWRSNPRRGHRASAAPAVAATATHHVQVAQKVAVGLKTRQYTRHEQESCNECSICLVEFAMGDKVGDLPCAHVFHVEPCLKKWIVRRNHCPLCQAKNLAAPTTEAVLSSEQLTTTAHERDTVNEQVPSNGEQGHGQNENESPPRRDNATGNESD